MNVDGKPSETYDNVTTKRGDNNVATKVNAASKLINIEEVATGSALMKPDKGAGRPGRARARAGPAVDRATSTPTTTSATPRDRTGFSGLEAVDEVTMVAVPDLVAALRAGRHRPRDLQGRAARR